MFEILIDSVEIAVYPAAFRCTINDLDYNNSSEFGRSIDGTLNRNRIAVKRTLELIYTNAVKSDELSTLLQQMSEEFFQVTYFDIYTGQDETKTFYVGDRPTELVRTNLNDGTNDKYYFKGGTFRLIER